MTSPSNRKAGRRNTLSPRYRYRKGDKSRELRVISREELIRLLEKCHAAVWQGGKLDSTTAFDEVSKLLFCKMKDEKDGTKKNDFYNFQIGAGETPYEVFTRINALYCAAKKRNSVVFKEEIKLEPAVVYTLAEHLQSVALNKIDLDTKGIAFERFMQDFFKGKMGQFFTPTPVVEFCIKMLGIKPGESVLDPACGTGGFLLHALDCVRNHAERSCGGQEAKEDWCTFARHNLFGIEINDKIARVCKMNMIIHDGSHANVINSDGLQPLDALVGNHKGFSHNKFDLILTNPPFGATVKRSEKDYLDEYELGKDKKSQKSEILFLERCFAFLKEGTGRMAIVLPDSILVNKSLQYVRDFVLSHFKILAITSLPDFTFSHYGANVKSSILFVQRLSEGNSPAPYPVFFAAAEHVGYTASGKLDEKCDFDTISRYHHSFLKSGSGLEVAKGDTNTVYVVSSKDLLNVRLDPKGHSPRFKKIKATISKTKLALVPLQSIVVNSTAGEWGLSEYDELPEGEEDDWISCYVLRNTNFDNNFNLDLEDIAVRVIKKQKVDEIKLLKGDILLEKSGGSPIQPVGRVAIIQELPHDKPVVFSNFLQKLVIDKKDFDPVYVFTYLRTLYRLGYMEYIQNQTTGIKNLLMDDFMDIPVVKIDRKRQEMIAREYVSSITDVSRRITEAFEELDSLKDRIGANFFEGPGDGG
jgi:type I restriction enzyme M protein